MGLLELEFGDLHPAVDDGGAEDERVPLAFAPAEVGGFKAGGEGGVFQVVERAPEGKPAFFDDAAGLLRRAEELAERLHGKGGELPRGFIQGTARVGSVQDFAPQGAAEGREVELDLQDPAGQVVEIAGEAVEDHAVAQIQVGHAPARSLEGGGAAQDGEGPAEADPVQGQLLDGDDAGLEGADGEADILKRDGPLAQVKDEAGVEHLCMGGRRQPGLEFQFPLGGRRRGLRFVGVGLEGDVRADAVEREAVKKSVPPLEHQRPPGKTGRGRVDADFGDDRRPRGGEADVPEDQRLE